MPKVLNISDTESLSDQEDENESMDKVKKLESEMESQLACSRHTGDIVASSSGTNLRASLIGMGFSQSLIDKVIKEKGDEDTDLLLDTLFAHSDHQKSNSESSDSLGPFLNEDQNNGHLGYPVQSHLEQVSQVAKSMSSDSLDSLLNDEKDTEQITSSVDFHPKQEAGLVDDIGDDRRASLLMMNFSADKVDFAIEKLGRCAPINELVDFIMAAEIAECENGDDLANDDPAARNEDNNTEALFGTMDKTLQLLGMGFNEQDVSLAIEKLGSGVPITELANWICARQMGESYPTNAKILQHAPVSSRGKHSALDGSWYLNKGIPSVLDDAIAVKTEESDIGHLSQSRSVTCGPMTPKEEYNESTSFFEDFNIDDIKGKRPKEEYEDDFSSCNGSVWKKKSKIRIVDHPLSSRKYLGDISGVPEVPPNPNAGRSLDKMVSGRPYFLYGNVGNLSTGSWQKVSQFLYALQPEFVYTQFFSALNRKEGYVHNLPSEDRFHIHPKSPMTIEEVIPHTKKWWPSWDTRKHLSCISSEVNGISQICSNLEKILKESRGVLSGEQQTKILYYCRKLNLVWVGQRKLAALEPEYLERILGYPMHHTRNPDASLVERLESLRNCFQTDSLGYYLSVLKPLYPGGITVLSLYSGIGGAEVTLHRLGIYLKGVVSVESSEMKRRILGRWWQNTDQAGELVQIDDIQKLTSNKLEYLMKKLGGFDLIICQNPCTYASKNAKSLPEASDVEGLDFTLYYEFVRVLQRVRTMAGRM